MKTGAEQLQHRSSNHTPGPIFCRPIRADSCHSHKSPVRVPFVGIIRLNPGSLVQISVAAPPESDPIRLNPTIKTVRICVHLRLSLSKNKKLPNEPILDFSLRGRSYLTPRS
jgi:hypothetical protein